jgi:integrase
LAEYEKHGRRSIRTARGFVTAIEAELGQTTLAVNVADKIDGVQLKWQSAGLTNATINRRCNLLRRGLRLLVRKRKLAFVPFIDRLAEDSEPQRYITPSDADAIRAKLPPYLSNIFSLALLLGIRRGQLSRTQRRFVDLGGGLVTWPPSECKHKKPHRVPLDSEAFALVEAAMGDARTWCPYLFHGPDCAPGRTPSKEYGCVGDFKKAFQAAVQAAGLPFGRKRGGVVFHCTRSTAATDLRAGGMEEADVMKIGGWETAHVFRHYDLGDVEKLRERLAAARSRRGKVVPLKRQETA